MTLRYKGKGYTDQQLRELLGALEQTDPGLVSRIKSAFKSKTFSYGTSGKQGGIAKRTSLMAESIRSGVTLKQRDASGRVVGQTEAFLGRDPSAPVHSIFQAGARQTVQRQHNYQMMDMFYGDAEWGGNLSDRADPDILEFVMYGIKLRFLPGWEGFNTWSIPVPVGDSPYQVLRQMGVPQGYMPVPITDTMYGMDDWDHKEMSATKEISRIVRWGVGEFGGRIIFDGAEVYYDQVFNKRDRLADTDLEARVFFQFFSPGSSKANFGRGHGTVEFHWHGKEQVPSKLLFLTSWNFDPFAAAQWYKLVHPENFAAPLASLRDSSFQKPSTDSNKKHTHGNAVYQRASRSSGPYQFGRNSVKSVIAEEDIRKFATNCAGIKYLDLWEHFLTFPPGVQPWSVSDWLNGLA